MRYNKTSKIEKENDRAEKREEKRIRKAEKKEEKAFQKIKKAGEEKDEKTLSKYLKRFIKTGKPY